MKITDNSQYRVKKEKGRPTMFTHQLEIDDDNSPRWKKFHRAKDKDDLGYEEIQYLGGTQQGDEAQLFRARMSSTRETWGFFLGTLGNDVE